MVPARIPHGPSLSVGVIGAGSSAVPHASESARCPPAPLPAVTFVPNAVRVRSKTSATGARTSVMCSCTSRTELGQRQLPHTTLIIAPNPEYAPLLRNAVVHDRVHALRQRIHLHAAPHQVHRLRRPKQGAVQRVRCGEQLVERLERAVVLARAEDEVFQALREVRGVGRDAFER